MVDSKLFPYAAVRCAILFCMLVFTFEDSSDAF